ncbi:MAG: hypothetical protein AB7O89_10040 [Parachlamydiales bacterium]
MSFDLFSILVAVLLEVCRSLCFCHGIAMQDWDGLAFQAGADKKMRRTVLLIAEDKNESRAGRFYNIC